jgi:hypothetical protein
MIALLQTIATVALGALLAGQVAVTRTGRLRRAITANLDLLDRLPAEHPHRATLEAHNGELLAHRRASLAELLADAEQWARTISPAEVLSQIGSPFAPDQQPAPGKKLNHAA